MRRMPAKSGSTCGCWIVATPLNARASLQVSYSCDFGMSQVLACAVSSRIEAEADRERHPLQRRRRNRDRRARCRPGSCRASAACRPPRRSCRRPARRAIAVRTGATATGSISPIVGPECPERAVDRIDQQMHLFRLLAAGMDKDARRDARSGPPPPRRARTGAAGFDLRPLARSGADRAGNVAQRGSRSRPVARPAGDPPWRRAASACSRSHRRGSSGRRCRRAAAMPRTAGHRPALPALSRSDRFRRRKRSAPAPGRTRDRRRGRRACVSALRSVVVIERLPVRPSASPETGAADRRFAKRMSVR